MDSANAASAPSQSKPSSLPQRLASAAMLIPGALLVIWIGGVPASLLAALVAILCLREFYTMLRAAGYRPRWLVGVCCAIILIGVATLESLRGSDLSGMALAAIVMLSLIAELPVRNREETLPSWGLTLIGAIYIGWFVGYLILIRGLQTPLNPGLLSWLRIEPGAAWIYTILGITWWNDSAAYLVGRRLGRHRMTSYISPKKSWEGAIGGILGGIAWALIAVSLLGLPISYLQATVLGIAGATAAILGDLVESLIKRQAGVKDSGTLIPGHGGMLDRVDSLLFVAPTLYYLILALTQAP